MSDWKLPILIGVFLVIMTYIGGSIGYQVGLRAHCPTCHEYQECEECETCVDVNGSFNFTASVTDGELTVTGFTVPCDLSFYNVVNTSLDIFTTNCTNVCNEVLCKYNYTNSSMICHHCFKGKIPEINISNCTYFSIGDPCYNETYIMNMTTGEVNVV